MFGVSRIDNMAYNTDLEYRIDKLASPLAELHKRKMFGGIGYMLNGNMCCAIHKDYLIIRTSIQKAGELLKDEYIMPFDITGRAMKGWLMISHDYIETDAELSSMVKLGIDFARNLAPK